jgi:hypothetical protein
MKAGKQKGRSIFAIISVFIVVLPLLLCSCSHAFPYQGSLNGNWSGQLTILSRNLSLGGTMSAAVDEKGVVSGSVKISSGGSAPLTGKVDSDGNITGTVSFTVSSTTFNSTWQGKITSSGNSLNMQGTWTSDHGSGTFSGTGTGPK